MDKKCRSCGKVLPVELFRINNKNTGYRKPNCPECDSAKRRERYKDPVARKKHQARGRLYRSKRGAEFWHEHYMANAEKHRAWNRESAEKAKRRKQEAINERGGCCEICGWKGEQACMDFHHIVPSEKKKHVTSHSFTRKYAETLEELKKCAVLDCRCHRELHAGIYKILGRKPSGELIWDKLR